MYWTVICWSIFIVKESHHQKPIYFQEQINMLRKYLKKNWLPYLWDVPKPDFKQLSVSHNFSRTCSYAHSKLILLPQNY